MTPIGSQRCPHCDAQVVPEPALPFGAVTCESCARALWFLTIHDSLAFFRYTDAPFVRKLFQAILGHQRIPAHLGFDSFDALELISEFEAALANA